MSKEWYEDFKCFAEYIENTLGECPEGYTLDRINNEGHYEAGNAWASNTLQSLNTRKHYKLLNSDSVKKYHTLLIDFNRFKSVVPNGSWVVGL